MNLKLWKSLFKSKFCGRVYHSDELKLKYLSKTRRVELGQRLALIIVENSREITTQG